MTGKILTAANVVTIFRIGLFGIFLVYVFKQRIDVALPIFFLAWALDAVDGFLARYFHEVSEIGSFLDKFTDRMVVGLGVLAFMSAGYIPPEALLILTKDIGLLPALTVYAAKGENPVGAGWMGKLMTLSQGIGMLWLIFKLPYPEVVITAIAIFGGYVAVAYLRKI